MIVIILNQVRGPHIHNTTSHALGNRLKENYIYLMYIQSVSIQAYAFTCRPTLTVNHTTGSIARHWIIPWTPETNNSLNTFIFGS